MSKRCSRRTNMLPLDWDSYDRQDKGYDMVTNMIGNEEDLGEYDQYHNHLALFRWHPMDLDKKGHKERYLIVSHPAEGWNTWEKADMTFKEACQRIKEHQDRLKEDREWEAEQKKRQ